MQFYCKVFWNLLLKQMSKQASLSKVLHKERKKKPAESNSRSIKAVASVSLGSSSRSSTAWPSQIVAVTMLSKA